MGFTDGELIEALPTLRKSARGITKNQDDADDLVSDTVIRALSNRDRFTEGTNLRGWLYIIMRNIVFTNMRRMKFEAVDTDPESLDIAVVSSAEDAIILSQVLIAVNHLPARKRNVVMAIANGETYRDVALMFDLTEGTVKSTCFNAREQLRIQFDR